MCYSARKLTELQSVTKPVLIVQGQEDALVAVNAISMSKGPPNAKLIIYPDAGQAAFFQYYDDFVQKALDFLGK
jgi:pimeloyl-ACP methyl ester carboxylesterase